MKNVVFGKSSQHSISLKVEFWLFLWPAVQMISLLGSNLKQNLAQGAHAVSTHKLISV